MRRPFAAHMPIEADHPITGGHHDMQIMADQQNSHARIAPHLFDQAVETRLSGLIETLGRFVQNQNLRCVQQSPRQKNALQLPPRKRHHLPICQIRHAAARQGGGGLRVRARPGQGQKAPRRHGQRPVNRQPLRHIADSQPRPPHHFPARKPLYAQQSPQKCRFPRPVRPDDGHDLSGGQAQADAAENLCAAKTDRDPACGNQAHAAAS